jgi:hypothetical protein
MKTGRRFNMFVGLQLLLLLAPLMAGAAEREDAMVTLAQGEILHHSGDSKGVPARTFMKVRAGDQFTLSSNARLQLTYLQSGRQEIWQGAAKLQAGTVESRAISSTNPPEIKRLPEVLLKQLAKSPGAINNMKNRTGMILVRAIPYEKKLAELRDNYQTLRSQAGPEDITPELYLVSAYFEMKQYAELKTALEEMRRRQPDNPEIENLYVQYTQAISEMEKRGK